MIFLIAATLPGIDAKIAKRFGHAPYYLILDSESLDFTVIDGPDENEPSYDFGRFANMNLDGIILGNIGPAAFNNLTNMGMTVYSCHGMSVTEAIKKVRSGEVPALESPTMKRSVRSGSQGSGKSNLGQSGHIRGRGRR
ncbi:MAG: NifB/NifX family molybdenum-iron cluster-binding protein [Calditrichaeota bacterium]|nr:NifB/NifX family molybdenum-iron cluster-binding protein [Calditrichota bacterium]